MRILDYLLCFLLLFTGLILQAQEKDSLAIQAEDIDILDLSLKELMELEVITASLKQEKDFMAPSNITVITRQMIEERGYRTLVEICEDIPGFDFLDYEDGGGEYTTCNMNRGLGTVGNEKIMILVDGIIQNHISFNWSTLWSYEHLLNDIDRIEIIQGPGSAIYGAQAFTGIIHFITRSRNEGGFARIFYGSNYSMGTDIYAASKIKKDINFSIALLKYNSEGDGGDRYDPGNYFHGLRYPMISLQDYDTAGNYVTNAPNPQGGEKIPDGFQNWQDSYSGRLKLEIKNTEIGFFIWNREAGNSSTYLAYEYDITNPNSMTHTQAYHTYVKNQTKINKQLVLESNIVYRVNQTLPETGFEYTYRFIGLKKNYLSYARQTYIEERFNYTPSKKTNFLFGLKKTLSTKSPRNVSLGASPNGNTRQKISSWNIANAGLGLNVKEMVPVHYVDETAIYGLWNSSLGKKSAFSLGARYDYSCEYGDILNPRTAFIYHPTKNTGFKLLYGTAFRQPSIYELNDEFRGNKNLSPEKISTYELEIHQYLFKKRLKLRSNLFYSEINDFIDMIDDENKPAGERFENYEQMKTAGLSVDALYAVNKKLYFFANYMYLQGKFADSLSWSQIERTAKHKINAGMNLKLLNEKLNINCRINYVGKRKAQSTNKWLNTYEGGYAPAYKKVHLVISYQLNKKFTFQLSGKNIFNEQYYGIGREAGAGMIDEYDYQNNPNPEGFVPAYHPQAGRTFLLNVTYHFD